jgi:hypothetical protein
MAEIIGGLPPHGMPGQPPDVRGMAQDLKNNIDNFNDLIPPMPDQMSAFCDMILALDETSRKCMEMIKHPSTKLMEDVQDSALTIQNILTQPLSLDGSEQNVSLVSAAKHHKNVAESESELTKIGMAFLQYPDQTQALKAELMLTSHDLTSTK